MVLRKIRTHLKAVDPLQYVTSNFLSPRGLFYLRSALLIYAAVSFTCFYIQNVMRFPNRFWYPFYFFTNLSFVGLIIYLSMAAYSSWSYIRGTFKDQSQLCHSYRFQCCYSLLYEALVTFHIVVPIVYWVLIAPSTAAERTTAFLWWKEVTVHGLDCVIAFTEVFFNRVGMCFPRFALVALVVAGYILYAFTIRLLAGIWVYQFLDISRPHFYIWYLALASFFLVAYTIAYQFHRLRDWIARKRTPTAALPMANTDATLNTCV